MVSTRSKTAQTHLEDFAINNDVSKSTDKTASARTTAFKANISRKRKSTTTETNNKDSQFKRIKITPEPSKKPKLKPTPANKSNTPILINRAPVLHLWAASVAQTTHPNLPWSTCLSAGSAISSLCAIAKGRSIGTISEADSSPTVQEHGAQSKKNQEDLNEVEVMHFKLKIKDGRALVGSEENGKDGGEDALRKKFGERYEEVKGLFEEALRSWRGDEEGLNREGFRMYEVFRPGVGKGTRGWGRKGELDLEVVRRTVWKG